jgi:hypothetical protein
MEALIVDDNDALVVDDMAYDIWQGGKPAGCLQIMDTRVTLRMMRNGRNLVECFTIAVHGSVEKAYEAGVQRQQQLSDENGWTLNQYRWRQDEAGYRYVEMRLTHDKILLFDDQDFETAVRHTWSAEQRNKTGKWIARIRQKGESNTNRGVVFASFITGWSLVSFKDGNSLNCRRQNMHHGRLSPVHEDGRAPRQRGISRSHAKNSPYAYWQAEWRTEDGKLHHKSFSILRYGEYGARQLAIDYRTNQVLFH